mmetsp:Transcript_20708/g.43153  ORF Transcript_20708/g.43153 Transcript_20708/m.43153 type:complete len:227 (-) Transcript_20708:39-719(-)
MRSANLLLLLSVAVSIDALKLFPRRSFLPALVLSAPSLASAFDNGTPASKIPSSTPKRPGPVPKDLGLKPREALEGELGLKSCFPGYHCFTTSADAELDYYFGIPLWEPPKSTTSALLDIAAIVDTYPVPNGGVDGGGFQFMERGKDYVYVVFESEKKGFRDDVEFALVDGGKVAVRTSSRVGYLDFGVNAKRLNYLSAQLRKQGWQAPPISRESHGEYWEQNGMK